MVKRAKTPAEPPSAPPPGDDTGATDGTAPPPAFPIVGIGASAGGLAAFGAFFSGIPADVQPGMAYVLVQHLAPDHTSMLAELVGRMTHLPVSEATDGLTVAVNHVYVCLPGWDLALCAGKLRLVEPVAARGRRLPIDGFFHSLALDLEDRAIAVVLSGTGSDGAQGVREIKRAGGLVLVQTFGSTEFNGMIRAALDSGAVDHELAPQEMPDYLRVYAQRAFSGPPAASLLPVVDGTVDLSRIFHQLRQKTGHDFSQYKSTTVQRRVRRRMAVHAVDTVEGYAAYLQQSADEVHELFGDLLIGVTRFFRDAEAFRVLESETIPQLLAQRKPGQTLRVWVSGCSTGEEAYSIAMLLLERLDEPATPQVVQVFATDIDSRAIAVARAGVYATSLTADLSPERLARHFTPEPGGLAHRVRK